MELRNSRFEGHSALTDHASFLRRKKHRGARSSRDGGVQHHDAVKLTGGIVDASPPAAAANGGRLQGTQRPARRVAIAGSLLRKPERLDLAAIVAPGVAKNQGTDAAEAFRAVGLTSVIGGGGGGGGVKAGGVLPEVASLLSPPHLFWKAVLVAPSQTRGSVGAWLQAKLGGGEGGRLSEYQRGLASRGLSPPLQAGGGGAEDVKVACGSSCRSRLIHRSLRWEGRRRSLRG